MLLIVWISETAAHLHDKNIDLVVFQDKNNVDLYLIPFSISYLGLPLYIIP